MWINVYLCILQLKKQGELPFLSLCPGQGQNAFFLCRLCIIHPSKFHFPCVYAIYNKMQSFVQFVSKMIFCKQKFHFVFPCIFLCGTVLFALFPPNCQTFVSIFIHFSKAFWGYQPIKRTAVYNRQDYRFSDCLFCIKYR